VETLVSRTVREWFSVVFKATQEANLSEMLLTCLVNINSVSCLSQVLSSQVTCGWWINHPDSYSCHSRSPQVESVLRPFRSSPSSRSSYCHTVRKWVFYVLPPRLMSLRCLISKMQPVTPGQISALEGWMDRVAGLGSRWARFVRSRPYVWQTTGMSVPPSFGQPSAIRWTNIHWAPVLQAKL
jgi:hypothetical protein